MNRDVGEDHFPQASILLVDDHEPNLTALQAVLEPLGHRLVPTQSGAAALELCDAQQFAVILSDVMMPGMDGFDLVARLREREHASATPVILLTALDRDREWMKRAYMLGAVDVVQKPLDPDLLRWRVEALVSLFRRGEELKRRAHLIAQKESEAAVANEVAGRAVALAEEGERLVQRKDTFISILGHDLRTPLSAILPGCQRLSRASNLPEELRPTVDRIVRAAERMNKMITDILDFARSSSGTTFPLRARFVDLDEVLTAVLDELRSANPDRSIELVTNGSLTSYCDPDRVAQALGNLVMNAVQHGEGPVTVSVDGRNEQVTIKVHNAGNPIPSESTATLFDPFSRDRLRSDGLGLGLHIVKGIVEAHGGTVRVESSRAAGTTFEASWPKTTPTSADDGLRASDVV